MERREINSSTLIIMSKSIHIRKIFLTLGRIITILIIFMIFGFTAKADAALMVNFATTYPQLLSQNDTATFSITLLNHTNGSDCPSCSYTISTSPSETVTSSKSGNIVTGSFTVTRKGTYSLLVSATDPSKTTQMGIYTYLVNSSTGTVRYYFRSAYATHGQVVKGAVNPAEYGTGTDNGSLLLTPPQSPEDRLCGTWVQDSIDQLPSAFPMSSLLSSFSLE